MKNFVLKQFIVWTLILVSLIIFSVFTVIIGNNRGSFLNVMTSYRTVLSNAEGIYVGTRVTIHGKRTGNVVKTILLSNGKIEVHFTAKKNHAFILTESSILELNTFGALGDQFLNIITKDLSAKRLEENAYIPHKQTPSLTSVLLGKGGDTNILKTIDQILKSVNEKGLAGVLSQTNQKDLNVILKSTKNLLQKVESGQGTLGALVNDRALYNRLLILLGQRSQKNYLQDLSKKSQKAK